MRNARSLCLVVLIGCAIQLEQLQQSIAYDFPTHDALALRSVEVSSLSTSTYLRDQLGFSHSVDEGFLERSLKDWIGLGARTEDTPNARVRHHFHNPLRPWTQAGLTFGIQLGESSLIWNQEPRHDSYWFAGNGSWSWHNARKQYLDALTQSAKANREKSFTDLFRSLGQGIHLLQDATVPAHVRNDAHLNVPVPFTNIHFPDPDGYEKWALNNAVTAGAFIGLEPAIPPNSIFTATGDNRAPSPVARLFDTDRFQGGSSSILGDPSLGIAEFTNGNFLSKSTIFRNFALPRAADLSLNQPIDEIVNGSVERYFSKALPTGETVTHFVREGMLRKALRAVNLSPDISSSWVLDGRVHADYARLLLPRAVGYSASMLDYFFRGRLDVDISNNPTDATLIRLEGTNGSTEKLDGGTIELYGEDSQGVRTAATPVGSNVVVADPGQPISVTFRPPLNSDKFMAVYKGKLGDEAPQGDFIGAVIGKFINPQRVEQIFTDFTRWYIRSPQGVFPLPLLKIDVDDLQWGDSDNMMVGRSSIGPGRPNIFYTYRINRMLGETHIPLTVTNEVDIQLVNQYSFPFGADSGTTVQFSHVMPYKQYLLWRQARHTQSWVSDGDEPDSGHYVAGPSEVTYGISLLVNETKTTNLTYRVVLDTSSHVLGPGTSQYLWDVWSIHVTTDGRPLALVQVQFTTNNLGRATLPARTLGAPGDSGEIAPSVFELSPVQVPFGLPELGPMWLLVDVTTGQMLANTAPSTMTMIHTNGRNAYDPTPLTAMTYRSLFRTQSIGGPQDGFSPWFAVEDPILPTQNQSFCSTDRLTKMMDVVASASISSLHVNTQLTQNRSEIARLEFADIPPSDATILDFPIDCGDEQRPPRGFRITVAPGPLFAPSNVGEFGAGVLRTTPVAGTEKLVFLMSQAQNISVFSQRTKVISWSPALSRIEGVQEFTDLGLHALTTASRDAALFVTLGNDNQSRLVDLSEGSTTSFPNQLLFNYALLDPAFFYNTSDFKFHVKDSSLASTGQPLSLAPAPNGNPGGRYHLLKVGESIN